MEPLRLITPPAAEPVTTAQLKGVLGFDAGNTSWDGTLAIYLVAARELLERWTRTAFITQTWLWRLDSFPDVPLRYDRNGYPQILLPKPPFQSIDSFVYVDTSGNTQTLTRDPSYGVNLAAPFYGYQLDPGGGIMPAGLTPPWARPWPPQRMVPANVTIQFRCGYGGPLAVSIEQGSALLSAPGFTFNPDDAPQIEGDTGIAISIPGAGSGNPAGALNTNVASVDGEGNATLADAALATVSNAQAWLGDQVPMSLQLAVLFQAQFFFEQGAVGDQVLPRVIDSLSSSFRNLVS